MAEDDSASILNINVGILGHVDSGKTSLGKSNRFPHPPPHPSLYLYVYLYVHISPSASYHSSCILSSAAKALSTTGSTAAFDKNPQSQERGITLDLGMSYLHCFPPARASY